MSRPLYRGKLGLLYKSGSIGSGLLLPLLIKLGWRSTRGKPVSRSVDLLTSAPVLVGGLMLRAIWILAGRVSANTPEAMHTCNAMERSRNA